MPTEGSLFLLPMDTELTKKTIQTIQPSLLHNIHTNVKSNDGPVTIWKYSKKKSQKNVISSVKSLQYFTGCHKMGRYNVVHKDPVVMIVEQDPLTGSSSGDERGPGSTCWEIVQS